MNALPTISEVNALCESVQAFTGQAKSWPESRLQQFRENPAQVLMTFGIAIPGNKEAELKSEINKAFTRKEGTPGVPMSEDACFWCVLGFTIIYVLLAYLILGIIILVIVWFFPQTSEVLLNIYGSKILAILITAGAEIGAALTCSLFNDCSSIDLSKDIAALPPRVQAILAA